MVPAGVNFSACNNHVINAANHISIASATRIGTAQFNYERDFQLCKTCPDDAVPCEDWPSKTTREILGGLKSMQAQLCFENIDCMLSRKTRFVA